jgi:hypothetical protein
MPYKLIQVFIFFVFCFSNTSNSQQYYFSLSYEEFGIFFSPKKCVDTIDFTLSSRYPGYKLKLYLKDCKGEAYFELFDKKNGLRMSGNYDNAIDTLKKYRLGRHLAQPDGIEKYSITAIKYLYPLKSREWIYHEGTGKRKRSRTVSYIYTIE